MASYANGKIPGVALATTYLYYPGTTNGRQLRKDVAPYAEAMATAFYLEFGKPLYATDGYRDYGTQVDLKREKGPYAATPGTSNHGWGVALDLASGVNSFSSAEHKWLRANAHRWGFAHPTWAHDGNSANGMDEAWHWEFVGGGSKSPRVERPRGLSVGLGARGPKAREVQELLRARGHKLSVDGAFGLGTAVEVLRFQKARGLKQDGKVGLATRRALKGKASKPKPAPARKGPLSVKEKVQRVQGAVHARQDGVWGPDTDKRVGALKTASVYGGSRFPFTVEFTQGVVGVKSDGVWGPKSAAAHTAAVTRIQAVLGLKVDGIYGPATHRALAELEGKAS